MENSKKIQCPNCKKLYEAFRDSIRFSINITEFLNLQDTSIVLRGFFERAEEYMVNPILMDHSEEYNHISSYIKFTDFIDYCPYCDKIYLKDRKDHDHMARIQKFQSFLSRQ